MRKIVGIMLCSLLVTTCDLLQNDDDKKAKDQKNIALALLAAGSTGGGGAASNVVQNVKAVASGTKSVTFTWDAYVGAATYNIYYTCSASPQASTVPALTTVTDPTVVASTTGVVVTASGTTAGTVGTEVCSATVVNIVKSVIPTTTAAAVTATTGTGAINVTTTITVANVGLPYKFIVTAVGTTETAASSVVSIAEVLPTQAQRLIGVYMVGGMTGLYGTQVSAVDMYDPDTSTWFAGLTTLPTPVSFAGIASEVSKIVVVGGFTSTGATSGLTQVYDILSNSWSNKAVLPSSVRANMGVANFSGKIYLYGGTTGTATGAYTPSNLLDIYDVSANTNSTGANWAGAALTSSGRSAVALGGVIYNSGGTAAAALTPVVTHDGYHIAQNVITTGITEIAMPVARAGHSLIGYSNSSLTTSELWILGGVSVMTGATSNGVLAAGTTAYTLIPIATSVQAIASPFSITGQLWTTLGPPAFTVATAYGDAVVDSRNGDVYYSGGNPNTSGVVLSPAGTTTFIKTNVVTKTAWATLTAMPTARWGHTAVIPVK